MAMPISAFAQLPEKKFSQKFSVILVDDKKTLNRCLKLRYDIFTLELGAELQNDNAEMDIDIFDPYWDATFGVADVFVLLDSSKISHRYTKHFIERI